MKPPESLKFLPALRYFITALAGVPAEMFRIPFRASTIESSQDRARISRYPIFFSFLIRHQIKNLKNDENS